MDNKFTKLNLLNLNYNRITDITPLASLTNLTSLFLENNQISDISPLAGLANIDSLRLRKQTVGKPSVKSPDVSVPTAKSADSSWVDVDAKNISQNGTYNKETGLVTWTGVRPSQSDYKFDFDTNVSIGKANAPFNGTVFQPVTEGVSTYAVDFDSRDGSAVAVQYVPDGGGVSKPDPAPTRDGYAFKEWTEDPEGTQPYDFATPVTKDLNLYAQWTPNSAPAPQPSGDGGGGGASGSGLTSLPKTGSSVSVVAGAALAVGLLAAGLRLARRRH